MKLFRQNQSAAEVTQLEGARVLLRPAAEKDWQPYAELRAASRAFLEPWEPTWPDDALTRASFQRRIARYRDEWRTDKAYSFLIFARSVGGVEFGTLIGGVGISNIRRGVAQTGTLGYWTGAAFAGQGLMGEAVGTIIGYCFGELGLHRIDAACLPINERSRRLLESAAFVREGYAEKYLRIHGEWQDHLLFGLSAESFDAD